MSKVMTHTHTKNHFLWKVLGIAVIGSAIGFFLPSFFSQHTEAKSCEGESGNLEGYILTDNLGEIYVSKKSWDEAHPGDPADSDFYVSYDVDHNRWSGRGLNEDVGWVDFDYDQRGRKARFVAPGEEYDRLHDNDSNNDEPVEWGNWRGIADLSDVEYDRQYARFVGLGHDDDPHTGEGDQDEHVGSGNWNFDHVELVKSSCPEDISLFFNVNGTLKESYHKETCPIEKDKLIIQWRSEGVKDCKSVAGPWDLIARPEENTGRNVRNTSDIDGSALFKLSCTGEYSGTQVTRTIKASCGETPCEGEGCEPCEGNDCPIIAPKLIEA